MKHLLSIILALSILLFTSCEKTLPPEDAPFAEDINGFHVKWRLGTTDEQRQIIRKIINDMVLVEGSTFVMGASQEQIPFAKTNEYPAHYVRLSNFYINRYELHPVDVKTILGESLSSSQSDESIQIKNRLYYSWEDWNQFISYLNDLCGLEFSFPTEAQWEFAARGGKHGQGYIYPGSNNFLDIWSPDFAETDEDRPMPNELGLYNMGNQFSEWCKDLYTSYGTAYFVTDPYCDYGDEGHVVRGGFYESNDTLKKYTTQSSFSFMDNKDYRDCRVSVRFSYDRSSWEASCRLVINIK